MMTGVFAFASAGPAALSGLAGAGAVDFAIFLAFTFGGAGLGVNGAGVNSTGSMAAVLLKQACEVHPSNIACGELRQLHPASITDKLPMRSILMRFPSTAELRFAFLAADTVPDARCDRFSPFHRVATIANSGAPTPFEYRHVHWLWLLERQSPGSRPDCGPRR